MEPNNRRPNTPNRRITCPPPNGANTTTMMHSNNNNLVPKQQRGGGGNDDASDIGTAVLHEIFSGGTTSRMRRSMKTLLPASALLLALTLCLPVILVGPFFDADSAEMRNTRRRKRKHMANIIGVVSKQPEAVVDVLMEAAVRVDAPPKKAKPEVEVVDGEDGDEVEDEPPRRSQGLLAKLFGGGYDDNALEDPHERDEIDQEPPSKYPIPDEIDEPLSNLFGTHVDPPSPLPPYSLPEVVRTVPRFHDNLAVLVYDPRNDKFVMHYSDTMKWTSGCKKLKTSFQMLANSLRLMFPERFDPARTEDGGGVVGGAVPELAISVSSGDYPSLNWNQYMRDGRDDCFGGGGSLSPVLQFGSVFRAPVIPTTTLAMPMPQWNHLHCFHYWTMHREICGYYLPRSPENREGLVFGEYLGLAYDDLIPQVVWRGTDFSYLHKLLPDLRRPDFGEDVAGKVGASSSSSSRVNSSTRSAAVDAMRVIYDELIPRWRGVVWTAEAERDAERINNSLERKAKTTKLRTEQKRVRGGMVLPWCNIKFAGTMHMGKNTPAAEVEYYQKFAEYGIPAAGEAMNLETLGTYKYHIDLGGGGGTTWSGTLEKLGLPGLLFHHVTPTTDYLHELLTPWVHYVPVEADLSDLREKYEWAEAHPSLAMRISQAATALAVSLGTPEGFEAMHRRFYEEPLRRVVEAYVPLGRQGGREDGGGDAGDDGIDWREALLGLGGGEMTPIMQCGGYYHHDCEHLVPDEWLKSKRRTGKEGKEEEEDGR